MQCPAAWSCSPSADHWQRSLEEGEVIAVSLLPGEWHLWVSNPQTVQPLGPQEAVMLLEDNIWSPTSSHPNRVAHTVCHPPGHEQRGSARSMQRWFCRAAGAQGSLRKPKCLTRFTQLCAAGLGDHRLPTPMSALGPFLLRLHLFLPFLYTCWFLFPSRLLFIIVLCSSSELDSLSPYPQAAHRGPEEMLSLLVRLCQHWG